MFKKMKLFFQKLIPFLKKRGIKGAILKLKQKISHQPGVCRILEDRDFVVDREEIPLDVKEYLAHKNDEVKILNWVMPEMGKGSGGHLNIFRFITNLEKRGFHSRIYLFKTPNYRDSESIKAFLRENFPILDERVEVFWDVRFMKYAHATFATSWETAYVVKNFNNTISKFYFVQDYEPYFYAKGSEYEFSRHTYELGLRGITAGDWLKEKLADEFGMKTSSFGFSYDKDLYKPLQKKDKSKKVFFYARPVTPRRSFELGILALDQLCKRMPEVEIVFAGWDVSNVAMPFKHQNLGIVSVDKLSKIYAECDMCLILSNTNLSLLPLEVMASNSVAVCSKGRNSTWLVNENNSILVDYDPVEIADTLEYYLKHEDKLAKIREKGLDFAQSTSWETEADKVKDAILLGLSEDEPLIMNGKA